MTSRWLLISCMKTLHSLELLEKRIGTSTLPVPLPSTYSIRLLDGFPYCRTREFIRFSIYSTKARTLPSYVASVASDLESGDSTVVLLLNFGSILQQKVCPTMEYAQLNIQNKNMYRCSTKMCPTGCAKNMFMLDFGPKHTKARELVNARVCEETIVFLN